MATFEEIYARVKEQSKTSVVENPQKTFDQIYAEAATKHQNATVLSSEDVNRWLEDSSKYADTAREYYGDSSAWKAPNTQLLDDIDRHLDGAVNVRRYFTTNRDKIDNGDQMITDVNNYIADMKNLRSSIKSRNDILSKYASQEEYDADVEASKKYQSYVDYDMVATAPMFTEKEEAVLRKNDRDIMYDRLVEKELDRIKEEVGVTMGVDRDAYRDIAKKNVDKWIAEADEYHGGDEWRIKQYDTLVANTLSKYGYGEDEYEDFKSEYYAQKRERNIAAYIQKGTAMYEEALADPEFKTKSQYIEGSGFGAKYEFINGKTLSDKLMDTLPAGLKSIYSYMSEDDIAMYNYFRNQSEREGDDFLEILEEALTTKKASAIVAELDSLGEVQNKALADSKAVQFLADSREWVGKQAYGVVAGTDQFFGGVKNAFDDREYIPASAYQKASAQVREDLLGDGGFGGTVSAGIYDTTTAVANMAPSVLASLAANAATTAISGGNAALGKKVGDVVGAGTMALSAYGNAKSEMLRLGYSQDQAQMYGALVAGSEAGLSLLMSGVSNVGGYATNHVVKSAVDGIDNAFFKIAAEYGLKAMSEGTEEALQEILTPMFKSIATSEKFSTSDINWGDVAYSYVIGALTASVLNTPDMAKEIKAEVIKNKGTSYDTVGLLSSEITDQEFTNIQSALEEVGIDAENAETIVGAMKKQARGEGEINNSAKALMNDEVIYRAVSSALGKDDGYRVISQEDVGGVTDADVADIQSKTGMTVAADEVVAADRAVVQDSEAVAKVHAERAAAPETYTPPTTKDVKAYSTEETDLYSRKLSRTVYMYDGESHAKAEAGFAEGGVVYINKNAPVNRNSVAVVLAHEYVHTIEGTKAYDTLAKTVFKSKAYDEFLRGQGLTHNEYLQQIADDYKDSPDPVDPQKEAVAKFLSEYAFQDANALMDLARTDRNWFQSVYEQIRRFIARLQGDMPNKIDLIKLDRMFAKAAKASNSPAQTQKSPTTESGAQYAMKNKNVAPRRRTSYNEFWTEVRSWANRADTKAGDMRVISDTRKGAQRNTFCLFEADGQGGCVEIATGSYEGVLEQYERAYGKAVDEIYVCVEAYGADKGRDIWDLPPDEIGRYAVGDYDTLTGYEFQRFPSGDTEHLWSSDQKVSVSNPKYSLPTQPKAENVPNTNTNQAATETADTKATRNIVSEPMSEQGYADESARAATLGVDFTAMPPKDPKMSASMYIEKTLADPTVPEVTKQYIRENENLYPVLTNAEMNARATEVLNSEEGFAAIVDKVGRGEAVLPHEMRALQMAERGLTPGAEAGRMIFISAQAARKTGQTLGSIRHGHTVEQYQAMAPEERRAALTSDYIHQAVVEASTYVNDFIDGKYHRSAGAQIDRAIMAFDAAVSADKDAMNRGYKGLAQTAIKAVQGVEDKYAAKERHSGTRVKKLMLHALQNDKVQQRLYDAIENGMSPMDALRTVINQELGIRSMLTSDTTYVQNVAKRIGLTLNEMYNAQDMDTAYELLASIDEDTKALERYVADHLTINAFDRFNSWRKFSMLSNVRTHVRNFSSNVVQRGVKVADDAVTQVIERALFGVQRVLGKEPTSLSRSVAWRFTEHGKSVLDTVKWTAEMVKREMRTDLGYDRENGERLTPLTDNIDDPIRGGHAQTQQLLTKGGLSFARPMFGKRGNIVNKLSFGNSGLLEWEDQIFFKSTFIDELGQRMTAAKVTQPTQQMIEDSRQAALYAVFRADNWLSDVVSKCKSLSSMPQNDSRIGVAFKSADTAFDTLLPFVKTPSNLLLNAIDHSPIGFVKTTVEILVDQKTHSKTLTTSDICQAYARNITGTGIAILGMVLSRLGIIDVFEDDDDEYNEAAGIQEFSLSFCGHKVSIDWMQPSALPFLLGAAIQEAVAEPETSWEDILAASAKILFDQSYLQSVQQVFDTSEYSGDTYLMAVLENLAKSGVGQVIPTAVGQLARSVDPTARKVWSDDTLQNIANTALSRIPGASYTLDAKIDMWGEDMQRSVYGDAMNVAQQFLMPWSQTTAAYKDDTTKELVGLFDTATAERKKIESDKTLTAAERKAKLDDFKTGGIFSDGDIGSDWVDVNGDLVTDDEDLTEDATRMMRRTYKSYLDVLIASEEYQQATTPERIDMIANVYKDVNKLYKNALETMGEDEALDTFDDYREKVVSGSYDTELISAYATVTLKDGKPLAGNSALCKRYESAVDEIYEARLEDKLGRKEYSWTVSGKKFTIDVKKATAKDLEFIKERELAFAKQDVAELYRKVDADTLVKELRNGNAYYVRKELLKGQ